MVEAAFSEDGKYFSLITNDGRLRIWDTETNVLKQEYTPDFHLKAPPTCLQWVDVSLNSSPKKGARKKSISDQSSQCIALGTTYGKILLYSVTQAKVETILENEKQTKKVQALDWHRKYGLFSCSVDNHVIEWDLGSSCMKHTYNVCIRNKLKQVNKSSAIKIVPHNQDPSVKYLVIASVKTNIWRFENANAYIVQSLSHTASDKAILTVATLGNSSWLIEGSQEERLLAFWDVTIKDEIPQQNGDDQTPTHKKRKKDVTVTPTPTYNFVLEDAPKFVDINMKSEGDTMKLSLVAATRSGVVHYYGHMLNGPTTKPIKPSVTIQVSTADANPLPLTCCQLPNNGDILLGYKNGPIVFFERVTPDLNSKTQVLIRGEKDKKQKQSKSNEATKEVSNRSKDIAYIEPMGGVSRKRPTAGSTVEVTMEARLQNLALDLNSRSKAPVNQNLTKLLMQGLHSDDKGLILTVLQRDDPGVASKTVASLPADYVPLLLDKLVDMSTRKTSQCSAACTWLTALLKSHSALLLASINARTADHVTQLLAIFTHRRSHLCQLLNLKGRLDLTISQRSTKEDSSNQEPILNYHDSSSDEAMEIEQDESSSGEQWEDEGDDDGDEDGSNHSDE